MFIFGLSVPNCPAPKSPVVQIRAFCSFVEYALKDFQTVGTSCLLPFFFSSSLMKRKLLISQISIHFLHRSFKLVPTHLGWIPFVWISPNHILKIVKNLSLGSRSAGFLGMFWLHSNKGQSPVFCNSSHHACEWWGWPDNTTCLGFSLAQSSSDVYPN